MCQERRKKLRTAMAALTKNSGWSFISYDVIPQGGGTMGMPLELTPLYEKARKKIKNALVETTHHATI